jgi:hypothetical protein
MQAYQVEFTPAQMPPLRIADAIPVETRPRPHVVVGDSATTGAGTRIPLAARLLASLPPDAPAIRRVTPYRDPKSGVVVLGAEQDAAAPDPRALVLLTATSNFPDGVTVTPGTGVSALAQGTVHHGWQMLLIWPEGGSVVVDDPAREARHSLRRIGDQFERTVLSETE